MDLEREEGGGGLGWWGCWVLWSCEGCSVIWIFVEVGIGFEEGWRFEEVLWWFREVVYGGLERWCMVV